MKLKIFQKKKFVIVLLWVAFFSLGGVGCSTTGKEKSGDPTKEEGQVVSKYKAKYYHFDDVLVPGELTYHQKRSFLYETPQFKAGTLIFSKWWLDIGSLINFFSYHMEKDHWKLINSYRGKENVLNFSKPDKVCTIKIFEKWNGMVEVEIRVGPLGEKKM